jgi:D-ornithine 4,5-aminomutase subunit alpha
MSSSERADDFATRRKPLHGLSDAELHGRFWSLVQEIVAPLIEEARTHTTPAIERSVLLRMGFTSAEAKLIVGGMHQRGWLGHGAGRLLLSRAQAQGSSVRQVGEALLAGEGWEALRP